MVSQGMVQYTFGAIGTILSWFIMNYCGRRTLYCWGLASLSVLLLVVGALGIPPLVQNGPLGWAIGAILVLVVPYSIHQIFWHFQKGI